jgi:hypothetical protein
MESSANTLWMLNAPKERAPSLVRKTLRRLNENAPNDPQDYFDQRLDSAISPGAVHREKNLLQRMCMILRSPELRINPLLVALNQLNQEMKHGYSITLILLNGYRCRSKTNAW